VFQEHSGHRNRRKGRGHGALCAIQHLGAVGELDGSGRGECVRGASNNRAPHRSPRSRHRRAQRGHMHTTNTHTTNMEPPKHADEHTFGGEHRPFEWGWRAVGLCSPCLWWWGRLCRRRCAAGGCARAVLVWRGVSRGYTNHQSHRQKLSTHTLNKKRRV